MSMAGDFLCIPFSWCLVSWISKFTSNPKARENLLIVVRIFPLYSLVPLLLRQPVTHHFVSLVLCLVSQGLLTLFFFFSFLFASLKKRSHIVPASLELTRSTGHGLLILSFHLPSAGVACINFMKPLYHCPSQRIISTSLVSSLLRFSSTSSGLNLTSRVCFHLWFLFMF